LSQVYKQVAPDGAFNPPLCLLRRPLANAFGVVPRLRDEGELLTQNGHGLPLLLGDACLFALDPEGIN